MKIDEAYFESRVILYVDDEQQAGKYFRKGLEKEFHIQTACSVAEAMAQLEKEGSAIAVVITDQRMPGQTGVELLSQVRQRWPAIVRMLITAYSDLDSAMAAVNAGSVFKYITKPAELSLLRQSLTEALAMHRNTVERDALAQTLRELEEQRAATQAAEAQREQLQGRLLTASRQAGRAEVATGVLHNVGNVLNSVNVAASVVKKTLRESKLENLCKALAMVDEHQQDLAQFLTSDERGQRLPGYLNKLSKVLVDEQTMIAGEMDSLGKSLEHIGQVVQMQQSYARESNLREAVDAAELMEDALRVNLASLQESGAEVVREFPAMPEAMLDRHKVLQILINLIGNAGKAVKSRATADKRVTLKLEAIERDGGRLIRCQVIDNGQGILPENLTRIFTHGFTTRSDGHGFGLHSSANAAREMGGALSAASGGSNQGATFTLELPMTAAGAETAPGAEPNEKVAA